MADFDINSALQNLGHVTSSMYGTDTTGYAGQMSQTQMEKPASSFSWSGLAHSAVHAAGSALSGIWNSTGLPNAYHDVSQGLFNTDTNRINAQRAAVDQQVSKAQSDYKAGRISKDAYNQILKTTGDQYVKLSGEAAKAAKYGTWKQDLKDAAQVGTTAATLLAPELGGFAKFAEGASAVSGATKAAMLRSVASEGVTPVVDGLRVPTALTEASAGDTALASAKVAGKVTANKALQVASDTIGAGKGLSTTRGTVANLLLSSPGKMVRNAVLTQPTVQFGEQTGGDVLKGDWKGAAENAGLVAGGAAAVKYLPEAAGAVKNALFDTSGLYDHVMVKGLDGEIKTVNQALDEAAHAEADGKITAQRYQQIVNALKVAQDQNLATHGSAEAAAKAITEHMAEHSRPSTELTLEQFANEQAKLAQAGRAARDQLGKEGGLHMHMSDGSYRQLTEADLNHITVGKSTQSAKSKLANALAQETEDNSRFNILKEAKNDPEVARLLTNKNNAAKIHDIMMNAKTPEEMRSRINQELTGTNELFRINPETNMPEAVTMKGGYHAIWTDKETMPFKSADMVKDIEQGHKAPLGMVGNMIRSMGLSPEPRNVGEMMGMVKDNFVQNLTTNIDGMNEGRAQKLWNAIRQFQGATTSVYDPRLLSNRQLEAIVNMNGIAPGNMRTIRKALNEAYTAMTWQQRGMGDKIVDIAMSKLPGFNAYLRLQSYGRFGLNPFFGGKVVAKSFLIAQAESGGTVGMGPVAEDVNHYIVSNFGKYSKSGIADFIGEGEANVRPGFVGKIQQNIAGNMVQTILKNNGMTIKDLAENPAMKKEVDHAIETLFSYPHDSFLNSNLARTLNIAIFPFRFEAKVASAGAHFLAQLNPLTRAAMVAQIAHINSWSKSPEGQQWAKDNKELVATFNYFSPTQTLQKAMEAVLHPSQAHLGDLGELGGLPFGIITTALSHQFPSVNKALNTPYTFGDGTTYQQAFPKTAAARAQQGMTDLISSLFSYPGATLGLKSKTSVVQGLPFLDPSKLPAGSYEKAGGSMTPSQQSLLKDNNTTVEAPKPLMRSDFRNPVPKAPKVPKTSTRRAKPLPKPLP